MMLQEAIAYSDGKKVGKAETIDRVLDILDGYYLWHQTKDVEYVTVGEEIRAKIRGIVE